MCYRFCFYTPTLHQYHLARQILRSEKWAECSSGCSGSEVYVRLWRLIVPNKIKVFGWRVCQDILPTRVNLARMKNLEDAFCEVCKTALETGIHVLWECPVAQDVWSGSLVRLQKST